MDRIRKIEPCHGCGETVLFIKCCDRHTYTADPLPVYIRQDARGQSYITKDGRFVWGFEVGEAEDDPDSNLIECYVPHKGHCPNGGRKRRRRA